MRQIASQKELEKLHAAGVGLIYNDFSGRGAGGAQYNVLHAAGCHWVARSNTNVRKLFFDNLAEAIEWLNAHRGPENKNWKRCGSCRPTTQAAANQAVANPRGVSLRTTPRSSSSAPQAHWRAHPILTGWIVVGRGVTIRWRIFRHYSLQPTCCSIRCKDLPNWRLVRYADDFAEIGIS